MGKRIENEPSVSLSVSTDPLALVPSNPTVIQIGSQLHWKPGTVIKRVQNALATTFEQSLYLLIARDFGIQPESLAKILNTYFGTRDFIALDMMERRKVGPGMYSDTFAQFIEFFECCMHLVRLVSEDVGTPLLSMELAAEVVVAYGDVEAEQIIESIWTNLDVCCEILNINQERTYSDRVRTCLYVFLKGCLDENRQAGIPDLLGVEDFEELLEDRLRAQRRVAFPHIDKDAEEGREAAILLGDLPIHQQISLMEIIDDFAFRFPASAYDEDDDGPGRWWKRDKPPRGDRP
jgi:hypothetical protein